MLTWGPPVWAFELAVDSVLKRAKVAHVGESVAAKMCLVYWSVSTFCVGSSRHKKRKHVLSAGGTPTWKSVPPISAETAYWFWRKWKRTFSRPCKRSGPVNRHLFSDLPWNIIALFRGYHGVMWQIPISWGTTFGVKLANRDHITLLQISVDSFEVIWFELWVLFQSLFKLFQLNQWSVVFVRQLYVVCCPQHADWVSLSIVHSGCLDDFVGTLVRIGARIGLNAGTIRF